jgi:NAD-dependent oxidoreductase involved in siderophore biosynthesis
LVSDYFSVEVAALAKLAYIKGIEVVVESSLVPKEILPIQELANYEGYDFFKEIGY